jgi:hypothetical protein
MAQQSSKDFTRTIQEKMKGDGVRHRGMEKA